jgi:hypothetical protein
MPVGRNVDGEENHRSDPSFHPLSRTEPLFLESLGIVAVISNRESAQDRRRRHSMYGSAGIFQREYTDLGPSQRRAYDQN